MEDFAAAAMLRLVAAGCRAQSIDLELPRAPVDATVPLSTKRDLVTVLLERHGATALLRMGESVETSPDEPALVALDGAATPVELLARWQRLERYVHSRHRVVALETTADSMVLQHRGPDVSTPPLTAESLLVFGLLVALMRRTGAEGLRARPRHTATWIFDDGTWAAVGELADAGCWEVTWDDIRSERPDASAGIASSVGERLRAMIETDPSAPWAVDVAAGRLALSGRSLQRRLRDEGTGFADVLLSARIGVASRLLSDDMPGIAEIGFICGFSDQAHFTRAFRRAAGLPPGEYRRQFAAGSG